MLRAEQAGIVAGTIIALALIASSTCLLILGHPIAGVVTLVSAIGSAVGAVVWKRQEANRTENALAVEEEVTREEAEELVASLDEGNPEVRERVLGRPWCPNSRGGYSPERGARRVGRATRRRRLSRTQRRERPGAKNARRRRPPMGRRPARGPEARVQRCATASPCDGTRKVTGTVIEALSL